MTPSIYNPLRSIALLGLAYCLAICTGCSLTQNKTIWNQPDFAKPDFDGFQNWSLVSAEDHYARAIYLEEQGKSECVQKYFQATTSAWHVLEHELKTKRKTTTRTTDLYRSSLAKLLITAQKFRYWNPCHGISIPCGTGGTHLAACFQGFVWQPDAFQQLLPVGDYESPHLSKIFRDNGIGVPLVAVRNTANPDPFMKNEQAFAATVILRMDPISSCYRIEFYDPLRTSCTLVAGCPVPLARDLTAPFVVANQEVDRQWLDRFLQPGATGSGDGLFMLEPYQPGKIPIVFVHGLLSDPSTWADLANEIRAHPNLSNRYQLWAYEYATGEPFLTSAAILRRQLTQVRCTYDPDRLDAAMSQMVLLGHSMGGLVAKLQVTQSGNQLWNAVANQPLSNVVTTHEVRSQLSEAFYFQPSMDIARVLYMGTPHLGSSWARRPVGRLGSALVDPAEESKDVHRQLTDDNPTLFSEELSSRFPTSIDLLEPESQLLSATTMLPYSPAVTLHSIVGNSRTNMNGEPTDGVVPVSSAHLPGVASELIVDAKHEMLHRDPATLAEVVRILREHTFQTTRQ